MIYYEFKIRNSFVEQCFIQSFPEKDNIRLENVSAVAQVNCRRKKGGAFTALIELFAVILRFPKKEIDGEVSFTPTCWGEACRLYPYRTLRFSPKAGQLDKV